MLPFERDACIVTIKPPVGTQGISFGVNGSNIGIIIGGGSGSGSAPLMPSSGMPANQPKLIMSQFFNTPMGDHTFCATGTPDDKEVKYKDRSGNTVTTTIKAYPACYGNRIKDKDFHWSVAVPCGDHATQYDASLEHTKDTVPILLGFENEAMIGKNILPRKLKVDGVNTTTIPAIKRDGSINFFRRTDTFPDIMRYADAESSLLADLNNFGILASDQKAVALTDYSNGNYDEYNYGILYKDGSLLYPTYPWLKYDATGGNFSRYNGRVIRVKDGVVMELSNIIAYDNLNMSMIPLYKTNLTGNEDIIELWRDRRSDSTVVNLTDGTFKHIESDTILTPSQPVYDIVFDNGSIYAVYKGFSMERLYGTNGLATISGIVAYSYMTIHLHDLTDYVVAEVNDLSNTSDFTRWLVDNYPFVNDTCPTWFFDSDNCNSITVEITGGFTSQLLLLKNDGTSMDVNGNVISEYQYSTNADYFLDMVNNPIDAANRIIRKNGPRIVSIKSPNCSDTSLLTGNTDEVTPSLGTIEITIEDFTWAEKR